MDIEKLKGLSRLIQTRNEVAAEITAVINRPAQLGHIGDYIAAEIFNITLERSASTKSIDGFFCDGALKDRSVNVKWYAKQEGLLDITLDAPPDYYLVLAGPRAPAGSSRGDVRPWVITSVHLFDATALIAALQQRQIKIGVATSVRNHYWDAAEIYPQHNNTIYKPTALQRDMLSLFG